MEKYSALEKRLDGLTEEIVALNARLDELTRNAEPAQQVADPLDPIARSDNAPVDSEALLSWVGRSSLLQRVSTLCFLLVVALLLRTLTDNGLLDIRLGSVVGMVYAALLLAFGWIQYRRSSPLAPVFAISGTVLMFMVVSETHARFSTLPSEIAYLLIIGAGAAAAAISYYNRVALPILVGTLGMCFAGVAVDYPNPSYPALVVLLFSANALGFVASRLHRCSWLRWTLFLITAALVQAWGYKIGVYLADSSRPVSELAKPWFFPTLMLFALGYFSTALFGLLRPVRDRVTRFDLALPVVTAAWALLVARPVVLAWWGSSLWLALFGLAAAGGYLSLALWFLRRGGPAATGAASLYLGAAVLAGLSLAAGGSLWTALIVLSGLALWAAQLSSVWKLGALRLISYVLQFYVCFELGRWLFSGLERAADPLAILLSAAFAVAAMWHYRWSLRHDPPSESNFFQKLDQGNRLCIFLLLVALVHAYYFIRGAYAFIFSDFATSGLAGFMGMQSVLINVGAVIVMIWALTRRDNEMRNLAILITLVGGIKVFLVDLFGMAGQGIEGFPLVASVFSFGAAVAIESLVLGRWLRVESSHEEVQATDPNNSMQGATTSQN
jgi:hypothetical protein